MRRDGIYPRNDPSSLKLTYVRDGNGRISAIDLNGTLLLSAVAYLPFGPLKTAASGPVSLSREYDPRYNITRIQASGLDYQYTRDAAGNVTSIANYQVPTVTDASTDYNYNVDNNQLTGTSGTQARAFTYDANGNMVSDGTNTFSYDGLNRLVKVENQSTTVVTYGYDSSNRRIRKTVGETTTHYLYDLNSQLVAETLLDGTPLREYIYLDGEPLALREYQENPGVYYFVNDHLGTPQRLVDGSGMVVWQAAYLPFGKAQVTTETVKNNLRFPGQYFDAETGLHYNWNRYYDPETGRYIAADPIGLDGGMNLYAYVGGNPVNLLDPRGLAWGNLDFSKYFFTGNGQSVTLGQIGHRGSVMAEIQRQGILDRFGDQIEEEAKRQSSSGPFTATFSNSYDFGNIVWAMGDGNVSGIFNGNVNICGDNYSYSGTAIIKYYDSFEDPMDWLELWYGQYAHGPNLWGFDIWVSNIFGFGTPYDITDSWTVSYSGSGTK